MYSVFSQRCIVLKPDAKGVSYDSVLEQSRKAIFKHNEDDKLIVPVVFHIIIEDPFLITNKIISDNLKILNESFQGKLSASIVPAFENLRGNLNIEFVLAKYDPIGKRTTGIVSRQSNVTFTTPNIDSWTSDKVKIYNEGGLNSWNYTKAEYLNIWIVKLDEVLGYASLPPLIDTEDNISRLFDGVVIDYRTMLGVNGHEYFKNYNLGRTLVHEVGHYLGLGHVWGPTRSEHTCIDDDGIEDTPIQFGPTSNICPQNFLVDRCTSISPGIMFENFMDYTNDACMTMFTNGQKSAILGSFNTFQSRSRLISPNNLALFPGVSELYFPCNSEVLNQVSNLTTVKSIGSNDILVGTQSSGLIRIRNGVGTRIPNYQQNQINEIDNDRNGNIWVAQSGFNGQQATTGGVLYYTNRDFDNPRYFGIGQQLVSRNCRTIFAHKTRLFEQTANPAVWAGSLGSYSNTIYHAGGYSVGLRDGNIGFWSRRDGVFPGGVNNGVSLIAGSEDELLLYYGENGSKTEIGLIDLNGGTSQIIDHNILGNNLPPVFTVKSMLIDSLKRKWLAIDNYGLLVFDPTISTFLPKWKIIRLESISRESLIFSSNAITSDPYGNVIVAGQFGLILYSGNLSLENVNSYIVLNETNGLPFTKINDVDFNDNWNRLVLIGDKSIAFWRVSANVLQPGELVTTADGAYNNNYNWCGGVLPKPETRIVVKHKLAITEDTKVKSVRVEMGGELRVAPGVRFDISEQ